MSRTIPIQLNASTPEQICHWAAENLGVTYLTPEMDKQVLLALVKDLKDAKERAAQAEEKLVDRNLLVMDGTGMTGENIIQAAKLNSVIGEHSARVGNGQTPSDQAQHTPAEKVHIKIGLPYATTNKVDATSGAHLYPDSDPKLPEHLAFADLPPPAGAPGDPEDEFIKRGITLPPGMKGRPKATRRPFRHPQPTEYLYNPENGGFIAATETMMRRKDLIPIWQMGKHALQLPDGAFRIT